MAALDVIFAGCGTFFAFGFGLSMMCGFVASGLVGVVNYILHLMGGK